MSTFSALCALSHHCAFCLNALAQKMKEGRTRLVIRHFVLRYSRRRRINCTLLHLHLAPNLLVRSLARGLVEHEGEQMESARQQPLRALLGRRLQVVLGPVDSRGLHGLTEVQVIQVGKPSRFDCAPQCVQGRCVQGRGVQGCRAYDRSQRGRRSRRTHSCIIGRRRPRHGDQERSRKRRTHHGHRWGRK